MRKFIIAILVLGTTFHSCNQKDDPTTTELIVDGTWTMTSLTINPAIIVNNVAITDYYSQLYDYDKDNILDFKTDGTFITDEGPLKEFPSDPQTRQGHWLLSSSETTITVWFDEDTVNYNLLDVTSDFLELSYAQRDTATQINYTLTAGFTKN